MSFGWQAMKSLSFGVLPPVGWISPSIPKVLLSQPPALRLQAGKVWAVPSLSVEAAALRAGRLCSCDVFVISWPSVSKPPFIQ